MKDTLTLTVKAKKSVTQLLFGFDLLKSEKFLKICRKNGKRFVILSDKKVASFYGSFLLEFMKKYELECFLITIEGGEKDKNRKMKEKVEDEMFSKKLGRDTCLIALGGGVVTDLGGFIAATYCRGIPYLTIPTSLLGMVDASIGGKTGVNVKWGKNLIGTFYPPLATFMDLSMLSTLPDEEMRSGSVEIIKHGLIFHSRLFEDISENLEKWKQRDLDFLKNIIFESCQVKKKIVEADFLEIGIRHILNFGHTIGHAIEALENYHITHGEALAIGMIVESLISQKMGYLKEKDFDAIYQLLKIMGFSFTLSEKITIDAMKDAMKMDKKTQNSIPRFVILNSIGKALSFKGIYCTTIDENILSEALGWMIAEFS